MDALEIWLEAEIEEKRVEPNSTLGEAIQYFLKHWERMTLFLRKPGAVLDNSSSTPDTTLFVSAQWDVT